MSDLLPLPSQSLTALPDTSAVASRLKQAAKEKNAEKIDEAARDFEAMFLTEMLRPMFEGTSEPDAMFGGGKGEEIFNGFMLEEYGKIMAERGGIGLAGHIRTEMIRMQENAQNTAGRQGE